MFKIAAIVGISFTVCLGSKSLVLPEDQFIPGWKRDGKMLTFRENDLYGHINGGAELFLEFGFQRLIVQNYLNGEKEITIEIYQMSDVKAAMGIYLMKKGAETVEASINARNSTNVFQSLAAKGEYYIQINNFSGKEDLIPAVIEMANFILNQIAEQPLGVFNDLSTDGIVPGSERIIRGPYALQPVYTFGEGDILSLGRTVSAVYAQYSDTDNTTYSRIRIDYPDKTVARNAFVHLKNNLDPYIQIREEKESGFIFSDYKKKYGRVDLTDRVMEIIFDLEKLSLTE